MGLSKPHRPILLRKDKTKTIIDFVTHNLDKYCGFEVELVELNFLVMNVILSNAINHFCRFLRLIASFVNHEGEN